MSNEEIRELIQLVIESGIAELEIERGEDRVRIRRTLDARQETTAAPASLPTTLVETGQHGGPPSGQPSGQPSASLAPDANEHIVKSPIVGTYYESPKPGDPPFVKVGDRVEPGQVMCIIESMKLMNEIESEIAGTLVAKLMESGRPVEYGHALFAIRPR